ncbi:MAG: 4Fe-4S binding protein [Anaerolineaceae bacterium]
MKILLIYISPGKTTEKISRLLADSFVQDGHEVSRLNIGKPGNRNFEQLTLEILEGVDLIGIGSPVFHMRILSPIEKFLEIVLPHVGAQTKAFIFLTYGGITTGKAFLNLSGQLEKYRVPLVGAFKVWAPHFFHPVQYPDQPAIKTVDDFCRQLQTNQYHEIEWRKVRQLFSYQSWKVKIIYPFTEMIGRLRELPIRFDETKCSGCMRCVNECPSEALRMDPHPVRELDKCIYCYHCTTVCPQNAVICATQEVDKMRQSNRKIIGDERPQNAIFF